MRTLNCGRVLRRLGVVSASTAAAATVGLFGASSAAAQTPESWTKIEPMSGLAVIGTFIGLPLLLFVVIGVLVLTPSLIKGPRYQPGLSWWARPEWFGGPGNAEELTRSGVSTAAGPETTEGGGASARW